MHEFENRHNSEDAGEEALPVNLEVLFLRHEAQLQSRIQELSQLPMSVENSAALRETAEMLATHQALGANGLEKIGEIFRILVDTSMESSIPDIGESVQEITSRGLAKEIAEPLIERYLYQRFRAEEYDLMATHATNAFHSSGSINSIKARSYLDASFSTSLAIRPLPAKEVKDALLEIASTSHDAPVQESARRAAKMPFFCKVEINNPET